tara:strand:+ start:14391 stop:15452 length:1062 start_codon:yes stop_codon:yes gene_type:complete
MLSCTPHSLYAANMLEAIDKSFGVTSKLHRHELDTFFSDNLTPTSEPVNPPIASKEFERYHVITNERYGYVCGVKAEFSDNRTNSFDSLNKRLSTHFQSRGNVESGEVKEVSWTGRSLPKDVNKVVLSQNNSQKKGRTYANTLTLQFDDYDNCMHVDKKYDGEFTRMLSQDFRCDVISSTFVDKKGVQFIDTSPPLPEYKNPSTAHLSFTTYRNEKRDTFKVEFSAMVSKHGYKTRRVNLKDSFFNTYYNPSTWAAKSKDVSFRAFPKTVKNGSLVTIGETGFVLRRDREDLTITKSGNVLTGIATKERSDEHSITHFTCNIQENDWQKVIAGFYQDAKRYTFEENGEITEGF